MATSTIPDITVSGDSWTELFTVSGITSGSNVVIQNKGSVGVLIQTNTSNTPPADNSGWALAPFGAVKITSESFIFVKSGGPSTQLHCEVA